MKTPDEIKKGLECCIAGSCEPYCKYDNPVDCGFGQKMMEDALAYIQQLETERHQLLTKNQQLDRERDAAVDDMRKAQGNICAVCKNYHRPDPAVRKYSCRIIGDFAKDGALTCGQFKWRGVKMDLKED